ncbi:DUF3969 family protein [Providencia manganoxydans]|uniref:DUF3969 family protein n=1 Tax=Providencia manganoxydans TaxID=2923283 RepID=UPI00280E9F5B|nr:DUF3969 family protein [Providencia stuartii]ELR5084344.1 DUF3969 family protein [Providencia stuartii]
MKDKFFYEIESTSIDKFTLVLILGVLTGLKSKTLSIDEANNLIFKPYYVKFFSEHKVSKRVTEIISKGCELEDVLDLAPEKFDFNINELLDETTLELAKLEKFEYSNIR